MAGKYPIQESLTESTQDPDINESSNGSQLETEPCGQSIAFNCSLTVEMIETPSMDDRPSRTESCQSRSPRYVPKYSRIQSEATRLSTYKRWPKQIKQSPQQLARAGLFFSGYDDCVCCYVCGGHIRQWALEDDPWIEHCRLFPLCPFTWEHKGEQFINQALSGSDFENEIFHCPDDTNDRTRSGMEQHLQRAVLEENRNRLLQMGYTDSYFMKAIIHLRNLGIMEPTVYDILNLVAVVKDGFIEDMTDDEEEDDGDDYEQSLQENWRLKSKLFCMVCKRQIVGILFLPCAHNKTCADCGKALLQCPACGNQIQEKIETSLQ